MSQAEVERFVADLKNNEDLRNELSGHASGIGSVVAFAKDNGYDVSAEEAGAYIQAQAGRELSDEQLDAIAGGKGSVPTADAVFAVVQSTTSGSTTSQALTNTAEVAAVEAVVGAAVVVN